MAEAAAVAAAVAAAAPAAKLSKQLHTAAAADEHTAGNIDDRHCSQVQGLLPQPEVQQLLLEMGKVLQASFLQVPPLQVLVQASQIQQGLLQELLGLCQARQRPLPKLQREEILRHHFQRDSSG